MKILASSLSSNFLIRSSSSIYSKSLTRATTAWWFFVPASSSSFSLSLVTVGTFASLAIPIIFLIDPLAFFPT